MVSRPTTIAVLLGLLVQLIAAQTSTWGINNRQITKDGEVFTVKGVNYAPLPPGAIVTEATQWGDLFHSEWAHLHDRDLPLMREAGVNAIRIYQLQLKDPISKQDLDHKSFFDKLYNNGDNPIYVMITYAIGNGFAYLGPFDTQPATGESWQSDGKWYQIDQSQEAANAEQRQIDSNIVAEIASEYGSHPAVMGFVIGNEQNNAQTRGNCKFWEWIDSIAARVKQAAPNKLTSTTIVDDNFLTVKAAQQCNALPNLDVWGINAYRGRVDVGFDDLFTDFAANAPQGLLITEFGCPASTRDANGNFIMMPDNSKSQGDYLKVHWEDIVAHNTICSGGFAFSWVDEWWKLNSENIQDGHDTQNGAFPGKYADEESYGLIALNVDCDKITEWTTRLDQALPRAAYFIMGQMFGAWSDIPSQGLQPINYPRCNGQWVGDNGTPNAVTPVDPQEPVAAVPTTTETPSTQEPTTVSTPIDNTPSVIAAPIDGTGNQNVNSATGVACSIALIGSAIIALIF